MKYYIYYYNKKKDKSYYEGAAGEYVKRLSRYCKVSCESLKKQKDWDKQWQKEDRKFLILPGKSSLSSEDFSRQMGEWEMSGLGKVSFFIPDLTELDNWIKAVESGESGNYEALHLSDFQLSTGLTRVVLLEQIYRGYRIMHHHPYHK